MNRFICEYNNKNWNVNIDMFYNYGTHFEFRINSRSGIMVLFGKTSRGYFACMPDFNCGCHLVDLKDKFWNTEKLIQVMGTVDGVTVSSALFFLADKLT